MLILLNARSGGLFQSLQSVCEAPQIADSTVELFYIY